jgi:hypothetical protein
MRTKQRFFLKAAGISLAKVAGISLALVMAFAMFAGCEQDTKIEYRDREVPGDSVPGGGNDVYYDGYLVTQSGAVVEAFLKGELDYNATSKGLYITAPVEIGETGGNFWLKAGQTIVVTEEANVPTHNTGALGSLFAIVPGAPSLTIKGGTLKQDGKLVLGGETAADTAKPGKLVIAAGATVLVGSAGDISTTATAGRIEQEAGASLIFETPDVAKVNIAGSLGDLKKLGSDAADSVVAVPASGATTNIAPETVGSTAGAEDIGTVPPVTAASTANASDISGKFSATVKTVIYTGTELGEVNVPADSTLIITGAVADGATDNSITMAEASATLEIASGASIDFGATGTITGTGTVTNNGSITTATASVDTLTAILAAKGTITASAIAVTDEKTLTVPENTELTITVASVTADKKLTLAAVPESSSIDVTVTSNAGTIDLGTNEISDLAITNTATGIIQTANETMLETLLGSVTIGTIEVSGELDIGTAAVKTGATLKVASDKTLTVTGTLTVASGASVTGAAAGAEIVVDEEGSITGAANFYYSNKTTPIAGAIPVGTYTWATDAGGEDTAGWKSDTAAPGTVRDTTLAAEVEWTSDTAIETINYSGNTALTGITVPAGKTLNITGNIANQAEAITVDPTGTATSTGTITTSSSINATGLTSLVKLGGNGTIKLAAEISLSDTLALTQNLEIGDSGKITYASGTAAFSGDGDVTISGTGKLDLGSSIETLGATITNNGDDADAISTATASGTALKAILDNVTGNITASGNITAVENDTQVKGSTHLTTTGTVTVPASATLTVAGTATFNAGSKLIVTSSAATAVTVTGTLDLSALTETDAVKLGGKILEVSGTLKVPAPETEGPNKGTTPEINYDGGSILLKYNSKAELGSGNKYIGPAGDGTPFYTWDATDENAKVELKGTEMVLNGKLTLAKSEYLLHKATIASGTLTVENGVTLTVVDGAELTGAGNLTATAGKVVVDKDATFSVSGTVQGDVTQVVEGIDISGPETPDELILAYVKKDLQTGATNGFVTIKLGGKVGVTIPNTTATDEIYDTIFSENTAEGALDSTKAGNGYSAVRITGLFSNESTGKITQYNQAFNMWTEDTYKNYIANEADTDTYDTVGVYKERSDYTGLSSTEVFDIALWNGWDDEDGDTPRIITLEITQPANTAENKKTFLIDFEGVEFDDGE